MRTNLLANPEHYRTEYMNIDTENDVLSLVEDFLRSNVNADESEFEKMFRDIKKSRNHEIRFDTTEATVNRYGNEGPRIAYGAFRHSALVHSTQTVWTYTFELLQTKNGLYLGTDSWGWLQSDDLSKRVDVHLE